MKSAVNAAKLGQDERLAALQRLDHESRRLEQAASGPSVDNLIAEERARSHEYEGRSVFGWEQPIAAEARSAPNAARRARTRRE
jgi:hypothetical protein